MIYRTGFWAVAAWLVYMFFTSYTAYSIMITLIFALNVAWMPIIFGLYYVCLVMDKPNE